MLASTTDLFSQNEKNNDSANNTPVSLIATFNNPGNSESLSKMLLHCSFAGYKLSSKALVQNLPLLNGLYENILCIMALHAVLFYFQTWIPFKAKEEEVKKKEESKEEDLNDDPSPSTASHTLTSVFHCRWRREN